MIKAIALLSPIYVTLIWALVFLIQNINTNKAKSTLGLFMCIAFLTYLSHAIFFSKQYLLYSYFDSVYIFAVLMLYPLFFHYISQLTNEKVSRRLKVLGYTPAIALGILSLVLTLSLNNEQRLLYVKEVLMEKNLKELSTATTVGIKGILFLIVRIVFIVQIIYYLIGSIQLANKHNRKIQDYFSDTEGRRMYWVRDISIVILVVSIAGIVFSLIGRSFFVKNEYYLLIPSLLFSAIYFEIGLKGNQQLPIPEFSDDEEEILQADSIENRAENRLTQQLIALFEEDKIYRQTDLRITTIASQLDTNRTYISRLINAEFEMNFNEFVNKYRIEETKQLLRNRTHNSFTMEYIAEKAGFGSPASFSRVFKEMVGTTPGKYREEHTEGID